MSVEGIFTGGREIKSASKRRSFNALPPPPFPSPPLDCAIARRCNKIFNSVIRNRRMNLRRNQALCASMHVCGDAAADQRDAASRSRAWQIVTTIPIQTPPTKASREEARGRGRAGEHFGIPSVIPKNTFSHSSEQASPPPRSLVGFSTSPLLSSPASKSIGVSGIITLSLGYPPIPRCCCEIFRYIQRISPSGAGTREEIDTI